MGRGTSPWQTLGPFFDRKLVPGAAGDLSRRGPDGPRAEGQIIEVRGRALDGSGAGVAGGLLEVWQANAAGRYAHPADRGEDRPLDPNFTGFGRVLSDHDGRFALRTIKPGPVPYTGHRWQAPHLLLSIFAAGLLRRLVTRIYFPDEVANDTDPVLTAIEDGALRQTLIAIRERAEPEPCYRFDIVLQGERQTAFFTD